MKTLEIDFERKCEELEQTQNRHNFEINNL